MKANYRGYRLECCREKCLGGWSQMYFTAYRISDGLEVICGHSDDEDTEKTHMDGMKNLIDEFIETKGESQDLADWYH